MTHCPTPCPTCGDPVPHQAAAHRVYCSPRCRQSAFVERRRLQARARCSLCRRRSHLTQATGASGRLVWMCEPCRGGRTWTGRGACRACEGMPWRRENGLGQPGTCHDCGAPYEAESEPTLDDYSERRHDSAQQLGSGEQ